jgi:hypothetical protein
MTTMLPTPPVAQPLVSKTVLALADHSSANTGSVALTNDLIPLLSNQLYRTPVKAIEELVVNSFDADAENCYLYVPTPQGFASKTEPAIIAVLDDGLGMDAVGLIRLWEIGRSHKRDGETAKKFSRKQIGKFGIGKLATHAIANCVTYISKSETGIAAVSLDYRSFENAASDPKKQVEIKVAQIEDWATFSSTLKDVIAALKINNTFFEGPHWTLCLLEDLKEKTSGIKSGRLQWVLSTAMPSAKVGKKFALCLNGNVLQSSKDIDKPIISFKVSDLPQSRLDNLLKDSLADWKKKGDTLVSNDFPSGVSGSIEVYEKSLEGKSDDLGRSHGFFIKVRDRLLNEDDPLFGLEPLSFSTFSRFRATINADDLDVYMLSSREEVAVSSVKVTLSKLLNSCFNEARSRYDLEMANRHRAERTKQEERRQFVDTNLVERKVADVLTSVNLNEVDSAAPENWFYLKPGKREDMKALADQLYTSPRAGYTYSADTFGKVNRMVEFDVKDNVFTLNLDHEFVQAYYESVDSLPLLHDVATAEALLEVHLRAAGVSSSTTIEILEQRDALLRGLATDHASGPALIARALRDAADNQYDLEIALIRATRTLGFSAKHIAGPGEPDGVARLTDYPTGEQKITLEAKSSSEIPSLSALDIAGLQEHVNRHNCMGCLLVAPKYPGESKKDDSAVSVRANLTKISCWTIEQLARVVEAVNSRHITAADVLQIVLLKFSPDDVSRAVEELLTHTPYARTDLYAAILKVLRKFENSIKDSARSIELIAGALAFSDDFQGLTREEVKNAVHQLAAASKGGMILTGPSNENISLRTSIDELQNRIPGLIAQNDSRRSLGGFIKPDSSL